MKIAHFSDLHLGIDDDDNARIAWLLADALDRGAEHVVIAGDLVDHGNLDDLRPLKKALKELGLWNPKRLTVVPGNHDIIGASPAMGGTLTAVAAAARDTMARRRSRLASFRRTFAALEGVRRGPNRSYASAKTVGPLSIIAIDTTDPSAWMQGKVGKKQREDLASLVRGAVKAKLVPVVVGHHRPIDVDMSDTDWGYQAFAWAADEDMNLADSEDVLGIVGEEGGRLYLGGHWHVLDDEEHYARDSGVRVFTQGRSGGMDADDEDGPTYSYDLVTIMGTRVTRRTVEYALADLDAEVFDEDEGEGEDEDEDGVLARMRNLIRGER